MFSPFLPSRSLLNAKCRICRRKTDPENMLLCDGCDRGHHMYCLKPKLKAVPKGDWFCNECKPKERVRSPKKKTRKVFEERQEEQDDQEDAEDEEEEEDGEEEAEEQEENNEEEEEEVAAEESGKEDEEDAESGSEDGENDESMDVDEVRFPKNSMKGKIIKYVFIFSSPR